MLGQHHREVRHELRKTGLKGMQEPRDSCRRLGFWTLFDKGLNARHLDLTDCLGPAMSTVMAFANVTRQKELDVIEDRVERISALASP